MWDRDLGCRAGVDVLGFIMISRNSSPASGNLSGSLSSEDCSSWDWGSLFVCPCSVEGLKGACMSFDMDELVRLNSFLLAERSRRTGSFSRGSQGLTASPKRDEGVRLRV